jgi:hypothetical protein
MKKPAPSKTRAEAQQRMHRALAELLRKFPAAAEFTSEVLELVNFVEADHGQNKLAAHSPAFRRGEGVEGYWIDKDKHGEVLVEKRHGNSKDFRCPAEIYRATAEVLANAPDSGLPFEDVLAGVKEKLDYRPAEYLSRICIRFWLHRDEPLLLRARSKYKPIISERFVRLTERAWRDLAAQKKTNKR